MTDKPLWTDDDIARRMVERDNEYYAEHGGNVRPVRHYIRVGNDVAREVRDDYQAALDAANARVVVPDDVKRKIGLMIVEIMDGLDVGSEVETAAWEVQAWLDAQEASDAIGNTHQEN